jgi:hypothetical protein
VQSHRPLKPEPTGSRTTQRAAVSIRRRGIDKPLFLTSGDRHDEEIFEWGISRADCWTSYRDYQSPYRWVPIISSLPATANEDSKKPLRYGYDESRQYLEVVSLHRTFSFSTTSNSHHSHSATNRTFSFSTTSNSYHNYSATNRSSSGRDAGTVTTAHRHRIAFRGVIAALGQKKTIGFASAAQAIYSPTYIHSATTFSRAATYST